MALARAEPGRLFHQVSVEELFGSSSLAGDRPSCQAAFGSPAREGLWNRPTERKIKRGAVSKGGLSPGTFLL